MGTCISKCKPKKTSRQDSGLVHDKLVISQHPVLSSLPSMELETPLPTENNKRTISPSISSSSAASFSSFSCSATSKFTLDSSISSASSCASSGLIAKERSFSNEYLVSCMKENQHVVGLNPVTKQKSTVNKIHPQKFELSSPLMKQAVQERPIVTAPKKRARSRSPSLVRQKSLRKDQSFTCPTPTRGLRSPSPSRRFNGADNYNRTFVTNGTSNDSFSRRQNVSRGSSVNSVSYGAKRESLRPSPSPNRDLRVNRNVSLSKKGTSCQQAGNVANEQVQMSPEMDVIMEDINNPLIALDCFIFL